jgi:hypothetical protein
MRLKDSVGSSLTPEKPTQRLPGLEFPLPERAWPQILLVPEARLAYDPCCVPKIRESDAVPFMSAETCGVCGGDGRVSNSFGLTTRCPACAGTGRKGDASSGMRDVTKTKPSHHHPANKPAGAVAKPQFPSSAVGVKLATEVQESGLDADVKARLVREITEYEGTHGSCTKTFQQKVRKQFRAKA